MDGVRVVDGFQLNDHPPANKQVELLTGNVNAFVRDAAGLLRLDGQSTQAQFMQHCAFMNRLEKSWPK